MMEAQYCVPNEDLPDWAKPKPKEAPLSETKSNLFAAAKKTAFIIGTALLAFASVRNSVTWHFESFWGASKNLYEDLWNFVFSGIFDENKLIISTFGTHIFLLVYFWLNSLFFMVLDIYQPAFFWKYKIQDDKKLEMPRLYKAIRVCLFNQFVSFLLSFPIYKLSEMRGMPFSMEELPTFHWVLMELCVFILVEEVLFYYTHRLGHHPRLYKHFHKIHHEWTASISIIGIYSHPIEHVISNLLPVLMGPMIMGSHIATIWLWTCMAITSTQISHCGYHLPFLPSPEAHDFHHLKFINNFGVLGVLDRFHGTDSLFLKSKAYDRHIMLIGLMPAKQRFPVEDKKTIQAKKMS